MHERDTDHTMNNAYYNINRETGEMTESPVIPLTLAQTFPRSQQTSSHSAAKSKGPELEKWKSRVPKTGSSPLVPTPLFSSAKCVVEAEPMTAISEVSSTNVPAASVSPTSTAVPTIADRTPISPSPSPSLFPLPPNAGGVVASPVSLHPSNSVVSRSSVYSQSTMGNAAVAAAIPRPASSVYSQNTLTTVTAAPTTASSPRTPTMTNWAAILPGLPNASALPAEMHAHQQLHAPVPMEQVVEEQLAPQQIQVPRLRSPSLPQDRGNRRRTIPSMGGGVNITHGRDRASYSNRPLVQSPEPVSYPEMRNSSSTAAMDYDGSAWPLQRPSDIHNVPQKHYVVRSQGSVDISKSVSRAYHKANKESTSSSITQTVPHHHEADLVASPRVSMADSHTPICGPGEQRSGWWTDEDEDVEQGRIRRFSYAVIGMKEKVAAEVRSRRARKIRIIVGASILAVLVIVGVAVGATLGVRS
ncbi:hypothetical protein GGR55DRAFT_654844 [Xylaria sp. FL0064]|nr:hypothetical protein GGR55DRAFT_654844 [Xylaria sp. FL0064]